MKQNLDNRSLEVSASQLFFIRLQKKVKEKRLDVFVSFANLQNRQLIVPLLVSSSSYVDINFSLFVLNSKSLQLDSKTAVYKNLQLLDVSI